MPVPHPVYLGLMGEGKGGEHRILASPKPPLVLSASSERGSRVVLTTVSHQGAVTLSRALSAFDHLISLSRQSSELDHVIVPIYREGN